MPEFIALLDKDSKKASVLFSGWAMSQLSQSPPKKIYSVAVDDRQDVIQNIILHCLKDDLKVLRKYVNNGRPFEAWFYWVARNKILDYLQSRHAGIQATNVGVTFDSSVGALAVSPATTDIQLKSILRTTNECIAELGQKCRLLLRMAGDEFLPREMARLLRMPKEKAKHISNDLGYCRMKLKERLKTKGILLESTFGQ